MLEAVRGYHGDRVGARRSAGTGVLYFERWQDNVLAPPPGAGWPTWLLRQVRGYTARPSWFAPADAEALAAQLGRISKFQSIHSEDAVTWSWFDTLACATPPERHDAIQWLYDRLDLGLNASADAEIEQWPRVFHPNAQASKRGPELDARIDDPSVCRIYVEAKWNAGVGTGKGATEGTRDDQIVLRRDSLRTDPALVDNGRQFVVLGISNQRPDLTHYEEPADRAPRRAVRLGWLTWRELAECDAHPGAAEFRHYLKWKQALCDSG